MTTMELHALVNSAKDPLLAPRKSQVTRVVRENGHNVTITIEPPAGLAKPRPGQFNMLYLFGLGEVPISASAINDDGSICHTVKAVGSVTEAIAKLKVGDHIWLRGPYGQPWPDAPQAQDLLLVAGGIGLAPLKPVIESFLKSKSATGKLFILNGARDPEDLIFRQDLSTWKTHPRVEVHVTVDRLGDTAASQDWQGSVGVVTYLLRQAHLRPEQTIVMTCGPEVMMRHVAADLIGMGIKPESIFVSLERNMKCATGICGRCQWGPQFVCRDGPVYPLKAITRFWNVREF